MIGQIIGNYRIESLLGAGGMGQVYRAAHVHLGRIAAVKVMHANLSSDPAFRARFLQEAKAAAALDHPNIIQIYDFGEQEGNLYLVMELATGGSVRGLTTPGPGETQRAPLPLSLNLILQAAAGLAFAHGKNMVHRDIKPDNLLLQPASSFAPQQPGYVVKISDFGLARLTDEGVKTSAGLILGTPAYMSPEQVKGEALDRRSDIYSLGVVLYELVVGRRPFEASTLSQAVYQHVFVPPPPPRTLEPGLPPLVEEIILRCLAKQPQDRYDTALELVADLHRVLVQSPAGSGSQATLAAPSPQASKQPDDVGAPTGGESAPQASQATIATEIAGRPQLIAPGPEIAPGPQAGPPPLEMKSPGPDAGRTEAVTLIEGTAPASIPAAPKASPPKASDIPVAGSGRERPLGREISRWVSRVTPATIRAGQRAFVQIENQGNVTESLQIAWHDQSGKLVFDPAGRQLMVSAGARQTEQFTASSGQRRLIGRRSVYPISVDVRSGQGATQSHQITVTTRPLIPYWLLVALLVICVAGAAYVLIGYSPRLRQLSILQPILARLAGSAPTATTAPTAELAAIPSLTPTPTEPLAPSPHPPPTALPVAAESHAVPTSTATETPRPTWTAVPTETPLPVCVVTSPTLNLRSGPGTLYDPPVSRLEEGETVQPLAFAPEGFPSGEWLLVQTTESELVGWVSLSYLDCGDLDVTQLPSSEIPPTPTRSPTPRAPQASGPYDFRADRAQTKPGECTYLRWKVQGVRAVYLNDEGVAGEDVRWVCPAATTTYTLRVVRTDNSQVQQAITITSAGQAALPMINVAADQQRVARGGCTTLRWNIQGVSAVYLNGTGVGGIDSMYVCPQGTTTYTWRIVLPDGRETTRQVTVTAS